jgi:uncharacterized protein (DUF4415 family)
MPNPPIRRFQHRDPHEAAEALFKPVVAKAPPPANPSELPPAKELVSLRIDRDVLERFQEGGPGWQDRINAALRSIAGK